MSAIEAWREYICNACGYVYRECDGDVDGGLAAGTRFEDIPDDWYCPICGVTKSDFVLLQKQKISAVLSSKASIAATFQTQPYSSADATLRSASRSFDVVIVGGGVAAWRTVEALRALSMTLPHALSIAMISQCEAHRYDKPLLSVAIARQLTLPELIKESGEACAARLGVSLFAQTTAISLDTTARRLRTTRGSFRYKHLVIAQGALSVLPKNLPPEFCWRINHLDQYTKFRQSLGAEPRHVLIVGAGLIGSELTNDLALGGHTVTLVDVATRPLARLLENVASSAALLQAWSSLPISFSGQTEVLSVKRTATGALDARLSSGENVCADAIVVAAGLQTSDQLAQSASLAWENGIVVEPSTLETSASNVYALGDCISIDGVTSRFIAPINRQATTIASQIAGVTFVPYVNQPVPVRIKTTSLPMTIT